VGPLNGLFQALLFFWRELGRRWQEIAMRDRRLADRDRSCRRLLEGVRLFEACHFGD
jgi:hypothetical protein